VHRTENPLPTVAIRATNLLNRKEVLIEEIRLLGEASYRRRLEIEVELTEIRRELERLGFGSFTVSWNR
jgi:hypothetical protein